jgi:hypothetical protein
METATSLFLITHNVSHRFYCDILFPNIHIVVSGVRAQTLDYQIGESNPLVNHPPTSETQLVKLQLVKLSKVVKFSQIPTLLTFWA